MMKSTSSSSASSTSVSSSKHQQYRIVDVQEIMIFTKCMTIIVILANVAFMMYILNYNNFIIIDNETYHLENNDVSRMLSSQTENKNNLRINNNSKNNDNADDFVNLQPHSLLFENTAGSTTVTADSNTPHQISSPVIQLTATTTTTTAINQNINHVDGTSDDDTLIQYQYSLRRPPSKHRKGR